MIFPLGIAGNNAFCNRVKECDYLTNNLLAGRHTLLISPRRYGKTSLALQVIKTLNTPFGAADFLMAADEQAIQNDLLEIVGHIVAGILPAHKKALEKIQKFFSKMSPKFVLSENGAKVELTSNQEPQESIAEALMGLDQIAGAEQKRVVLLMDEFQQLGTLKHSETLEAAIRHAVERAQNTSYIFSGSNRHLLGLMFEDRSRPLYHLCDRMHLERISSADYIPFLQKAAQTQWQQPLTDDAINTILDLTQRHTYYVNVLCARLWHQTNLPDVEFIQTTWSNYVQEERPRIAREVEELSPNQRAMLLAIAKTPTDQPTSKTFLHQVRLSSASAAQALQVLIDRDFIYRDAEQQLRILDPAMQYFFAKSFN